MKKGLSIILLSVLLSCQTRTEKISTNIEAYISQNFPKATFEIQNSQDFYKLVIIDKEDQSQKKGFNELMIQTLGNLYLSFYTSANSAATNSKFVIEYKSGSYKWTSQQYMLSELSDLFNIVEE